ncbi:phosphoesterase family-domain-containing protein [Gamsiella multidivaricata]|uniref:phosphoesterase family-domain-containing protein n=1 Tax=Gamsiella multidivaricata TaxID=101098 RepID=UPI00221EECEE|nr:phosphoesterase family-domain-containing protein [Gamsiella multidivaricata]KAG0369234.1 hypothetical protein BGZ54_010521 [Gamsiella multidivaricata]KAI7825125.1 phosphoesterase family-domain-containing protein [Gamsiella multidivaricata]
MLFKKLLSISMAVLATASTVQAAPTSKVTAAVAGQAFDHVFMIFLENTDYALAYSDPSFQSLLSSGILLNNYHALTHPSEPNYIASIAGSYYGVNNDGTYNFDSSYTSIVNLLEAKGLTWKTYQESMPSVCYTDSSYKSLYYRKHNPFISHQYISTNAARCKNVVPSTQLTTDLNNNALPNYSFFTPNIKNDGHDTTVGYAGKWLVNFLSPLLKNPAFISNTLVVVTFDEAEDYTDETNHVLALLLGDSVSSLKNTVDSTYYTHYSLLSTLESNWGLGNLGRGDVNKQLSNVFSFVAAKTGYQNVNVTNPPPLN